MDGRMSATFIAGRFEVHVADPSPRWVQVRARGMNGDLVEFRLHPDDLPDLRHVLFRADEAVWRERMNHGS